MSLTRRPWYSDIIRARDPRPERRDPSGPARGRPRSLPGVSRRVLARARRARARIRTAFVKALTDAGYLAALIPEEFGGSGLGIAEAVDHPRGDQPQRRQRRARATRRCTRWARCCGTDRTRRSASILPKIASGELRLQAFGVSEPTTGSDTTQMKTMADAQGRHVRRPRPEGLDLARGALRSAAARRAARRRSIR